MRIVDTSSSAIKNLVILDCPGIAAPQSIARLLRYCAGSGTKQEEELLERSISSTSSADSATTRLVPKHQNISAAPISSAEAAVADRQETSIGAETSSVWTQWLRRKASSFMQIGREKQE